MFNCGDGLEFPQGGWRFDSSVSRVFRDHAVKSIPGYKDVHSIVSDVCMMHDYRRGGTIEILDIGCSLGEFEDTLLSKWDNPRVRITAIDTSESMIENAFCKDSRVVYECASALDVLSRDKTYDVIVCLYTCQFMNPKGMSTFYGLVRSRLRDGGMFILADKFESTHSDIDSVKEKRLFDFKMNSGYSIEEIVGKKKALSGVQNRLPESHIGMIDEVFSHFRILDVSLNFMCIVFYA